MNSSRSPTPGSADGSARVSEPCSAENFASVTAMPCTCGVVGSTLMVLRPASQMTRPGVGRLVTVAAMRSAQSWSTPNRWRYMASPSTPPPAWISVTPGWRAVIQ